MNFDTVTYNKVKEDDLKTVQKLLLEIQDELIFDYDYYGWLIWGEKPIDEYLFEEGFCNINPKNLMLDIEDFIRTLNIRQPEDW